MYADLINGRTIFLRQYIWKIKVPLIVLCSFCLANHSFHFQYSRTCQYYKYVWKLVECGEQISKEQIWAEICALMWVICNYWNDLVFIKTSDANFFQVIHMVTHHDWSYLILETQRALMVSGCNRLETVAWNIYNQSGWLLFKRIQDVWHCFLLLFLMVNLYLYHVWSLNL
jgi:hypothetical protein